MDMGRGQGQILAAAALQNKIKVFLDDDLEDRPTPEGWVRAMTAHETIAFLEQGNVCALSLDHDLGGDDEFGTGYDVVLWLAEQSEAYNRNLWPDEVAIHSANFSRSPAMAGVINRYSDLTEHPGRKWSRKG